MRSLIDRVGPFVLRPDRDRFRLLVRSILSQQISTNVARAIRARLEQLAGPAGLTPAALLQLSEADLRSVGLSTQKACYLHDLAQKTADRTVRLDRIGRMSDESVIAQLVQVKGIGRWTAQMFLIFGLGRWDVMPHDDLGVRMAIRDLYGFSDLPTKQQCLDVAVPWQPFRSVASWYCWRNLDLKRQTDDQGTGYPT